LARTFPSAVTGFISGDFTVSNVNPAITVTSSYSPTFDVLRCTRLLSSFPQFVVDNLSHNICILSSIISDPFSVSSLYILALLSFLFSACTQHRATLIDVS
jgi:hypothetical protein